MSLVEIQCVYVFLGGRGVILEKPDNFSWNFIFTVNNVFIYTVFDGSVNVVKVSKNTFTHTSTKIK